MINEQKIPHDWINRFYMYTVKKANQLLKAVEHFDATKVKTMNKKKRHIQNNVH